MRNVTALPDDVAPRSLDVKSPQEYERELHPRREWTWRRAAPDSHA
jgi:hypothetical protein